MKFELTEEQEDKLKEWITALNVVYQDSEIGLLEYRFTPTGMGDIIEVYCKKANATLELSNSEDW